MRKISLLLSSLSVLALVAGATPITAVAASQVREGPSFCRSAQPIVATASRMSLALKGCPLQGRKIEMSIGTGQVGVGVHVPPPGYTTGNSTLTTHGSYALIVSNTGHRVTVKALGPSSVTTRTRGISPAADPACDESGVAYTGTLWAQKYKWYYNSSTASRAGLSASTSLSDLRQSFTNMTQGLNNCGFPTNVWNSDSAYQGDTSKFANINSSGDCTSNFPDGQNTLSWGPFSVSDILALTCWSANGAGLNQEVDTYLGSNVGMVDSLPSNCSESYDVQTIMTHESGHTFGLQDLYDYSQADQVMYGYISPCYIRHHLGRGDYQGMSHLYG